MKIGFDHEKYLEEQSKYILERVNSYDKLYLEFGGKLLSDLHAKRVLPGFDENAKVKLLQKLKDKIEVIICVYAGDIERNIVQIKERQKEIEKPRPNKDRGMDFGM